MKRSWKQGTYERRCRNEKAVDVVNGGYPGKDRKGTDV